MPQRKSTPAKRRSTVAAELAPSDALVSRWADTIATLRIAAYDQRLGELAKAMGVEKAPDPHLRDRGLARKHYRDGAQVAADMADTYRRELAAFLDRQPAEATLPQLRRSAKQWRADRAEVKARQVATTEGMRGRLTADADVLSRNKLEPDRRVEPSGSKHAACADLVGRGWMKPAAVDFDLPLHPHCVHYFTYRERLADMVAGRDRVWIGAFYDHQQQEQAA